jgi:mRNA interferase MazF
LPQRVKALSFKTKRKIYINQATSKLFLRKKGDLVLIPFPFTNLKGNKLRPALILVNSETDITVCFITTQLICKEATDLEISPSTRNGIKKNSLIRVSKIATLDKELALGKLGDLDVELKDELNKNLKLLFILN